MGRVEGAGTRPTPRLPSPEARAGFPSRGLVVGPAALVGEVAKLLTTDCKTLGWVAACDCTAALCCRFCSDGAAALMNLGCLGADTGWARGKLLGDSEARVVTRRGAGVVTRGDEVVNIGGEGAGVTIGGGVGPGLEAAWPELL